MTATPRRAVLVLMLLAACSGDSNNPVVPDGATVVQGGGNAQNVEVGAATAAPLSVIIKDAAGQPLAGIPVTWGVASGGGSVTPTTSTTDISGVATTVYTAGTTSGPKVIVASVNGALGSPVSFTVTAVAGPARRLIKSGGDAQQAQVGQFPVPLAVTVVDSFGNGVSGAPVNWAADPGGTVSAPLTITGNTGVSTIYYSAASIGTRGVTATSTGLTGSPVSFNETAIATIPLVKELQLPANYGLHDQYVRAGLAFLSVWNTGLEIYDVGDGRAGGSPANPVRLGGVVTAGGAVHNAWWYWAPDGDKRYVFVGQEGPGSIGNSSSGDIHVVDISVISAPVEVAFFHMGSLPAGPHNFWVDETNEILYAAYYNGGVVAINVSGNLGSCPTRCDLASRVVATAQPGGPGQTYVWGVQLYNGSLYATDMLSGFWQLNPVTLQTRGGGNNVNERYGSDQWVANGYAYSGTWGLRGAAPGNRGNAVKIWHLDGQGHPVLVDSVVVPNINTVSDVEVSADNKLLMFSAEGGASGVYFYSLVANPAKPTFVGYYPVTSGTNGVHTATFADIGAKRYVFAAQDPFPPALLILDVTSLVP